MLPFNIGCGSCFNCSRGYTNACLTLNPDGVGAGYGYAGMGPYQGGQAQYVRVPYAEFNALKLPQTATQQEEDDFLMLADILPTAYHATELAQVKTGMSVAIYGAGPVGLLAALSSQLKGASEIYVVDDVPARLALAEKIGATPINFRDGSPVEQIKERRKSNRRLQEAMRPGEEKMAGVSCGIDAVGYQCCDETQPDTENPTQVIDDLTRLVNPTGAIGIIGVFFPQDPGGADPHAKKGEYLIPLGPDLGEGYYHWHGAMPGEEVQLPAARSHHCRKGQSGPDRQPPPASGGRAGRLSEVRPARRRLYQSDPQAERLRSQRSASHSAPPSIATPITSHVT